MHAFAYTTLSAEVFFLVIPESEGSGLVEKNEFLKELSKRWKLK